MIIRCYRTAKYQNISEYETGEITCVEESMSDEDKEMLRNGEMIPMINFEDKEGVWHGVPVEFVISIRNN